MFEARYRRGDIEVPFTTKDLRDTAIAKGLSLPANIPDVPYNFNFRRRQRCDAMTRLETAKKRWYIVPTREGYSFTLDQQPIAPTSDLRVIKIPNATPEIITANAMTDEQSVLARVKYNRLVDIFLGITAYPLQSHLRTQFNGVQVEIDELYLGVRDSGEQFAIGVEAKTKDPLAPYQIRNCFNACRERFPNLTPRAVAVSWNANDDIIAMFELLVEKKGNVVRNRERHYLLVPSAEISPDELKANAKVEREA